MTTQLIATLTYEQIAAIKLSCAKKDIRYYLHGFCLFSKDSIQYAASTDGARGLVIKLGSEKIDDYSHIVPNSFFDFVKKPNRLLANTLKFEITAETTTECVKIHVASQELNFTVSSIKGKFPNILSVIPNLKDGFHKSECFGITNPVFYADVYKQLRLLDRSHINDFYTVVADDYLPCSGTTVADYISHCQTQCIAIGEIKKHGFTAIIMPFKRVIK